MTGDIFTHFCAYILSGSFVFWVFKISHNDVYQNYRINIVGMSRNIIKTNILFVENY